MYSKYFCFVLQVAAQESRKRKKEHMQELEDKYVCVYPGDPLVFGHGAYKGFLSIPGERIVY